MMKAKKNDLTVSVTDVMQINYNVLTTALFEKLFLPLCKSELNILTIYMLNSYSQPIKFILREWMNTLNIS